MRRIKVTEDEFYRLGIDVEFFVRKCVLLRGKPVTPYRFQIETWKHKDEDRIAVKARQIGFSWGMSWEFLHDCLYNEEKLNLLISLTYPLSVELLKHISDSYLSLPDFIDVYKTGEFLDEDYVGSFPRLKCHITKEAMEFENNSRVVSLPNNPDAARSWAADKVFWDEAAKFPHEGEMVAALYPTITRGGRVTRGSTHRGTGTMFYQDSVKAERKELPDTAFQRIPYTEIPAPGHPDHVPERDGPYHISVEKFRRKFGEKSFFFKEEFLCIPTDESVAMFPHEMLRRAQDLWKKHGCGYRVSTGKSKVLAGIDIGRTKDLTVLYVIEEIGEYAQVIGIHEWRGRPFPEQTELLINELNKYKPTWVHVDHTGMGMQLSEELQRRLGSRVELVDFNLPNKELLIINTYIQLQDNKVAIPPEEDDFGFVLYNQLHNVQREISEKTRTVKYVQAEGELPDDHLWAFCLAAAYLTNPEPVSGMYGIGQEESRLIVSDHGKLTTDIFRKEKVLQQVVSRSELIVAEKEKAVRERRWELRGWFPKKTLECPDCKAAGRKIKDSKGNEKDPELVLQSKTPTHAEYVCEGCFANVIKVVEK